MAVLNDNKELFKNLTARLSSTFIKRSEGDVSHINKILDDLNSLNFRRPLIGNQTDAILLIHNCCLHISPDDDIFVPKCCRLIANLINLQKVTVERRTFNDLMNWCMKILYGPEKKGIVTLEVIILLDALIRSTNLVMEEFIFTLLHPNSHIYRLYEGNDAPEILRYSLQLLEACTIVDETVLEEKLSELKESMTKCAVIFKNQLLKIGNHDDATDLKTKIICLRGLENIIRNFDDIIDEGLILGIIKYYMLLGVKNLHLSEILPLMPSSHSIPEPLSNSVREKKGGKVTKLRKHKVNKQKETPQTEDWMKSSVCDLRENTKETPLQQMVTSDSDMSDSGIQRGYNVPRLQSRIRQMSLSLLFNMAKKLQRVLLTYWTSFIPDSSRAGSQFLTNCILEDPSADCRAAALNVLLYMLTSSKLCLAQADACDRSAFTPFSAILGYMIISLHDTLNLALKEKITPLLAQVLKCYAALVEATPYKRLKPSLITEVVHNVNPLLQHKDPTIKTGALIVFGCILASEPIVEETKRLFLRSDLDGNSKNFDKNLNCTLNSLKISSIDEQDEISRLPSILRNCLDNLQIQNGDNTTEPTPLPVKIESLKIISFMCRNYFDCLVYPHLSLIGKAICDCLSYKNIDLKLHAGKTIDCIGQSMGHFLQESDRNSDGLESSGVSFWLSLLNGPLPKLFEDDSSLRSAACNCLGSIGSRIFENLSVEKHYLCVSYLLSCSRDSEEHTVRGASVRSLGLLAYYPMLREDPGFMVDVADAVYRTLNDTNIDVRLKSSWALGNLSDVLVSNCTNENLEKFPDLLIIKLLEKGIMTMKYNDKIKANVARGLGNLLNLIDEDIFKKPEYRSIIESAVDCLVKTASTAYSVKVRWNACYGISLLLKNHAIYTDSHKWMASIFATLNQLIINVPNFKVRTTAASALASPSKRQFYGTYYHATWFSLLKALENSQHVEDHQEYQHKDRLIEQICLTLAHLLSLCEKDDLPLMREALNVHYDICKNQMNRVNEILVPEKSSIILTAAEHLNTFNVSSLNAEKTEALLMLKDLIVQDF